MSNGRRESSVRRKLWECATRAGARRRRNSAFAIACVRRVTTPAITGSSRWRAR